MIDSALAIRPSIVLPPLPDDCHKLENVNPVIGRRLDVEALRQAAGRKRANARVSRCANWYEQTKAAIDAPPIPASRPKPEITPFDFPNALRRDQPK